MTCIYTPTQALRAKPTEAWISEIRARYPVETSVDEVFLRKLNNRDVAAIQDMDFTRLQEPLTQFLKQETGQADLEVQDLQRLSGGASKEQFTFDLLWQGPSGARETRKLMLRMEPKESIVETHRMREFQVM